MEIILVTNVTSAFSRVFPATWLPLTARATRLPGQLELLLQPLLLLAGGNDGDDGDDDDDDHDHDADDNDDDDDDDDDGQLELF